MKKLLNSFVFAFAGIRFCLKTGNNFKIQLLCAGLVFIAAAISGATLQEWTVLLICCFTVLSLEMLNTAVEQLCDLFSGDYHPLIKTIKDIAAGAVLLSAIGSAITAVVIFLPKIISLFTSSQ